MNIVVDSNIIFSALINPKSTISDILLNSQGIFTFYSPDSLPEELKKHKDKLVTVSQLSSEEIDILSTIVLNRIQIRRIEMISARAWKEAFDIMANLDQFDVPFVALALDLETKVWIGEDRG